MCLLDVWVITYNHELFIAEAIESILAQKTNFDFKIIIGEDCSTDRTREIVKKYKEQYPEKIELFLPDKNMGMMELIRATYSLCKGKYVASIDGDDYMTDPYKLQKQVDFFESNPDFVLHFHRANILNEVRGFETLSGEDFSRNPDNSLIVDHFLETTNPIITSSVMYRNVLGESLPEWYYHLPFPDYSFYFLLLEHGKIQYSPEVMSVYRIHKGGVWSGEVYKSQYHNMIDFYTQLQMHLPYLNQKKLDQSKAYYHYLLLLLCIKEGDMSNAGSHIKSIAAINPRTLLKFWKVIASVSFSKFILKRPFKGED